MGDATFEALLRDLLDLTPAQRHLVHRTVQTLLGRQEGGDPPIIRPAEPILQPPPEGEKVIHAMQRLRKSYPMLPPDKLLGPASEIMMQAMNSPSQEHPALIQRLEVLFADHYKRYVATFNEEAPKS